MDDPLSCLLSAAVEGINNAEPKAASTIHSGDTDSSDDEDNRDFENRKYNESGRDIKHLLDASSKPATSRPQLGTNKTTWKNQLQPAVKPVVKTTSEAFFGMRVVNPLVSSTVLEERMVGREVVPLARMKMFLRNISPDKDWVVAGVVVQKSNMKTAQSGKNYFMWTLSDLKIDLHTISVLLFGSACKELWKTTVGTVVGILNPMVMDLREGSKDVACLSINNQQRVMILGQSKDLGTCRSTRKDGEKCTAFVNKSVCEFCVYHVRQEYQKCSKRSELQSNFAGQGLIALRNKVLGKDQVFYAGKLYTAIPARKNKKQAAKDEGRLSALAGFGQLTRAPAKTKKQKQAAQLELTVRQRQMDRERLRQLGINSELNLDPNRVKFQGEMSRDVTVQDSKTLALDVINKLKSKKQESDKGKVLNKKDANLNQALSAPVEKGAEVERDDKNQLTSGNKLVDLDLDFTKLAEDNCQRNKLETLWKTTQEPEKLHKNDPKPEAPKANNKLALDANLNQALSTPVEKEAELRCEGKNQQKSGNKLIDLDLDFTKLAEDNCQRNKLETLWKTAQEPEKLHKTDPKPEAPKANKLTTNIPFLSGGKSIDLNAPIVRKETVRARKKALNWVQSNGPIEKQDPNNTRGTSTGKKRAREALEDQNSDPKLAKIQENGFFSERFKKMMAATSKHVDLLEQRDDEEQEKYFNKLEMKERMEEKMLSTYKVSCKAVRCLTCKYTSFSAAELCKAERHPLRVFDAVKRFFKCGKCGNRTVCLSVVPTTACKNCGGGKWERTGMMKEKKVEIAAPSLSIRGGEQKFVNSVATGANLDLLVPDS